MDTYIGGVFAVVVLMHFTFLIAVKIKRNDLADIVWGPGFLIAAAGALVGKYLQTGEWNFSPRVIAVLGCVCIWALRLATHISFRNLKKSEDSRYRKWREEWGQGWIFRSYWQVFLLQGFLLLIIALPIFKVISAEASSLVILNLVGIAIWFLGFAFESLADWQLKKFKSDTTNKGRLMTKGLWSWSRHPNYFGEVIQWWGIFLIVCSLENAWWTILSPIAITYLILKVSGVPMLEEQMRNRPGFADYQKRTSKFFPRPPRA